MPNWLVHCMEEAMGRFDTLSMSDGTPLIHHHRLNIQNGSPALKIYAIGNNRDLWLQQHDLLLCNEYRTEGEPIMSK